MTNDVEDLSFISNKIEDKVGKSIAEYALPKTMELYSKYDVEATFYMLGSYVEKFPETIDIVKDHGHEIGSHSFSHDYKYAYDNMSLKNQILHMSKSKRTIEKYAGNIESFRAPALRINEHTPRALEYVGFKTDSSVASQRFDGPMTSGALKKINWLFAPRKPYYMDLENPFIKGKSKVLEVPPSAFLLGYQGTHMRISPKINDLIESLIFKESEISSKPAVFLFHPSEILDYPKSSKFKRRSQSILGSFFSDTFRQKLKLRNTGRHALKLKENVLRNAKDRGFEFMSMKRYRHKYQGSTGEINE